MEIENFSKDVKKSNTAKSHRLCSNAGDRQEVAVREDVCCGFCVEKWSVCQRCGRWYHELCIGAEAVRLGQWR